VPHTYGVGNALYDFTHAVRPNALNEEQLNKTIELCSSLTLDSAIVAQKPQVGMPGQRISEVGWILLSEQTLWLFNEISFYLEELNIQFFGMDIYGFNQIQYTEYDASYSGKYDWHCDVQYAKSEHPGLHRKLSITIPLNDDFEGGKFQLTTTAESGDVIEPTLPRGSMLLFPSHITHRITPVTKGRRKSLVIWVVGPKLK
jgi:PKHD-type hydroxylase